MGAPIAAVIIQRYVFKQLLFAFLFAVGGILFVLVPAILVNAVHKVGSAGLVALTGYLPLVFADLIPYIVPLGFLLAIVTTFGRLAADREWTAIRSAGINPARTLTPCLVIAILLAIGTDYTASELAPAWKFKQRTYKREALENAVKLLSPGRTDVRFPGFFLSAARRDPDRPVFYEAHISILQRGSDDEDERDMWLYADRVSFSFEGNLLVARFTNSRAIKGDTMGGAADTALTFDLDAMLETEAFDPTQPKYMPSSEIRARLASGEVAEADEGPFVYEIHRRHALSATYFLFLLLGIPTGIRLRSSTQLAAFASAVAYAMVYYVLSLQLGRQLFLSGALPAVVAPWITNALGAVIGGWACLKALRK